MQDTSQTSETTEPRAAGFRAVENGGETRSGTVLLVEAYAALWLVLFVFIWMSFRKQRAIDARLRDLEIALEQKRKES